MRIAIVSPYDLTVPGGVQSHVRQLAARLRAEGEQVVVLGAGPVGVRRGPDGTAEVGLGRSRGVAFNGSVAPLAPGPIGAWRTRRALVRLAPDVIHVHEPLVPAVGLSAVFATAVPVVVTFHAWSDADRLYRLARPVGRAVLSRAAATLAVSSAAAGYHAGALGIDVDRLTIVPNGVDVARFAAARDAVTAADATTTPAAAASDGAAPCDQRLVFVGRLEPRKGVVVLARAFLQLQATHPRTHLTIIGDGPEREEVARILAAVPADRFTLTGRVEGDRLAALLADAEVAVAPALGGESFGIVLLEAMAAGTAVVASDIPGYRSVITDGVDGVLSPPGDDAALARVLGSLLDDEVARGRLVAAGTRRADEHDWSRLTDRLRQVYVAAVAAERHR